MNQTFKKSLTDYLKARYAVLVIESFEEERVLRELQGIAQSINHELYIWNSTDGVTYANGSNASQDKTLDFTAALKFCENRAKEQGSRNIFVFCDADGYLNSRPLLLIVDDSEILLLISGRSRGAYCPGEPAQCPA